MKKFVGAKLIITLEDGSSKEFPMEQFVQPFKTLAETINQNHPLYVTYTNDMKPSEIMAEITKARDSNNYIRGCISGFAWSIHSLLTQQ